MKMLRGDTRAFDAALADLITISGKKKPLQRCGSSQSGDKKPMMARKTTTRKERRMRLVVLFEK